MKNYSKTQKHFTCTVLMLMLLGGATLPPLSHGQISGFLQNIQTGVGFNMGYQGWGLGDFDNLKDVNNVSSLGGSLMFNPVLFAHYDLGNGTAVGFRTGYRRYSGGDFQYGKSSSSDYYQQTSKTTVGVSTSILPLEFYYQMGPTSFGGIPIRMYGGMGMLIGHSSIDYTNTNRRTYETEPAETYSSSGNYSTCFIGWEMFFGFEYFICPNMSLVCEFDYQFGEASTYEGTYKYSDHPDKSIKSELFTNGYEIFPLKKPCDPCPETRHLTTQFGGPSFKLGFRYYIPFEKPLKTEERTEGESEETQEEVTEGQPDPKQEKKEEKIKQGIERNLSRAISLTENQYYIQEFNYIKNTKLPKLREFEKKRWSAIRAGNQTEAEAANEEAMYWKREIRKEILEILHDPAIENESGSVQMLGESILVQVDQLLEMEGGCLCGVSYEWHPGPGIKVEKQLDCYPKNNILPSGSVIALSVLGSDTDIMIQKCLEKGKPWTKLIPAANRVTYEWKHSGAGTLLQKTGSTVLFKLPENVKKKQKRESTITCKLVSVRDSDIKGKIVIKMEGDDDECKPVNSLLNTTYKIEPVKERKQSQPTPVEGTCAPSYGTSAGGGITGSVSFKEKVCAKEIVLLSAAFNDRDNFILTCESLECVTNGPMTVPVPDPLNYAWSATPALGSFPLGNAGPQVVYVAPDSHEVEIKCTVTNKIVNDGNQEKSKTLKAHCLTCIDDKSDNEKNPTWLPQGNRAEATRGNLHKYELFWVCGDTCPAVIESYTKRRITVELRNVTRYRGVATNWGTNNRLDMWLEDDQNKDWEVAADSITATTKCYYSEGEKVELNVSSFDFGGSSNIRARAEGCKWSKRLELPWDHDDDGLPDKWEEDNKAAGIDKTKNDTDGDGTRDSREDEDNRPSHINNLNGDGLTCYEEYRGFYTRQTHERTNPRDRDIFIFDEDGLTLGWFAASNLTSHLINNNEWTGNGAAAGQRIINPNPNRGLERLGNQHGLYLNENTTTGHGLGGEVVGTGPGKPELTTEVRIYTHEMRRWIPPSNATAVSDTNDVRGIMYVVGHELAHGCALWHHREPQTMYNSPACMIEYFRVAGTNYRTLVRTFCDGNHNTTAGRGNCIQRFDVRDPVR